MPIDVVCALEPTWWGRELQSRLEPNNVILAANASEIDAALSDQAADMVIASTTMLVPPIEAWIREVRELPESPDVGLVHDRQDAGFRAAAIRAGCLAVLEGTQSIDELVETVEALIQRRLSLPRLVHATSPTSESRFQDFVSLSPRMREFVASARQVVDTASSVVLTGETGTGKERLARALHGEGPRSARPFVGVNCGALPESLAESELFGHEKGAFTGASRAHKGYFEQADGGTLFLDEIAELLPPLQTKLLRVLDSHHVQRLGGERSLPVDVRIIAATNRDLEREIAAGRFREDLYYRLAVVVLTIPTLRDRAEDIADLFGSYLEFFRVALNRPIYGVRPEALDALVRYRWPGNVRELINVAERAVLLAPGPEIGLADLPEAISRQAPAAAASRAPGSPAGEAAATWQGLALHDARQQVVADFERRYLRDLLRETGGRIGETARRAGVNQRSLFELMRRHGLRKEAFRPRRSGDG